MPTSRGASVRVGLTVTGAMSPATARATAAATAVVRFAVPPRACQSIGISDGKTAWREAYRGFGAKPQRTRNSLEALTRRAEKGLPRVNALTDIYNAISVLRQIPFGGEDFHCYQGPARLIRATGTEPFDTTANGEPATEYPDGAMRIRDPEVVPDTRCAGTELGATGAVSAAVRIGSERTHVRSADCGSSRARRAR